MSMVVRMQDAVNDCIQLIEKRFVDFSRYAGMACIRRESLDVNRVIELVRSLISSIGLSALPSTLLEELL